MSAADYGEARIQALFASIDGGDAEGFTRFLTEDSSFRFGSAQPVLGRENIAAGVTAFFATIAGCMHDVTSTIANGDTLVCEGNVTYTRLDRSKITVPFVDVFELTGDLINEYKIYIDTGPLYAS